MWCVTVVAVILFSGYGYHQHLVKQEEARQRAGEVAANRSRAGGKVNSAMVAGGLPSEPATTQPQGEPMDGEGENAGTEANLIGVWMGSTGMGVPISFDFRENGVCNVGITDDAPEVCTYEVKNDGGILVWSKDRKSLIICTISQGERGTYIDFSHYIGVVYDKKNNTFSHRPGSEHGTVMKR